MTAKEKLVDELHALALTMLFFGCWIAMLVLIKTLILAEYDITFKGFSVVCVGALILSKVVLVLEHVSLGNWVESRPAWVDLLARTALYALGVLVVLILEKAFETRHEYGGFSSALANILDHEDMDHVVANAIGLTGALLTFNFLSLVNRHLADAGIREMLRQPPPSS